MAFDVDRMRRDGFSDADIAEALAERARVDIARLRRDGYRDAEIIAAIQDEAANAPRPKTTNLRAAENDMASASDRVYDDVRAEQAAAKAPHAVTSREVSEWRRATGGRLKPGQTQEQAVAEWRGVPLPQAEDGPRSLVGEASAAAIRGARDAARMVAHGALRLTPLGGIADAPGMKQAASELLGDSKVLNPSEWLFDPSSIERTRNDALGRAANTFGEVAGGALVTGGLAGGGSAAINVGRNVVMPAAGAAAAEPVGRAIGGRIGGESGEDIGGEVAKVIGAVAPGAARAAIDAPSARAIESNQLGYVVPARSGGGGGLLRRASQWLAGKTDTDRILSRANDQNTAKILAKDLGLIDDAGRLTEVGRTVDFAGDITPDLLKRVRDTHGGAYDSLRETGMTIRLGDDYTSTVDDITAKLSGDATKLAPLSKAAQNFLKLAKKQRNMTAGQAIDTVKRLRESGLTNLRQDAGAAKDLGRAQLRVAETIEAHVAAMADDFPDTFEYANIVEAWKAARPTIAKSHQIEEALIDGASEVDPQALARQAKGGTSGGIKDVIGAAQRNPSSMRAPSKAGDPGGFSFADVLTGFARPIARAVVQATARPVTPYSFSENVPALLGQMATLRAAYDDANPDQKRVIGEQMRELGRAINAAAQGRQR